MADIYKTSGGYSQSQEKFDLTFNIESENQANPYYLTPKFDISKAYIDSATGTMKVLNAILICITKKEDDGTPFGTGTPNYPHSFKLLNVSPFPGSSIGFSFNAPEALVILFHDNTFNYSYVQMFFNDLIDDYLDMVRSGNTYKLKTFPPSPMLKGIDPAKPRTAGLTIISRKP